MLEEKLNQRAEEFGRLHEEHEGQINGHVGTVLATPAAAAAMVGGVTAVTSAYGGRSGSDH